MKQYLDYLRHVRIHGVEKTDRTGTGTLSVFGYQMRFNLQDGFPLVTTKRVSFKMIATELLWFLSGSTNNEDLRILNGNDRPTIWEEWAQSDGYLGPIYGKQWRHWGGEPSDDGVRGHWKGGVDQVQATIDLLRKDPDSRRIVVTPWNVEELPQMALNPCHAMFQFYVADGKLSLQLLQRSVDSLLGLPYNIASYSLLLHMFAQQCDLDVGEFIWVGGDCHIYLNHLEQVDTQLAREPYPLPKLIIKRKPASISDYKLEDFAIEGYQHHPAIDAPVAV